MLRVRKWPIAALVLAALLSACSAGAGSPAGETDAGSAPAGSGAPAGDTAPGALPAVLAEQVTDGLVRIAFAAGDTIDRPGIYLLDTATGQGEGWLPPPEDDWTYFFGQVTDDNRFLIGTAYQEDDGYIVDRQTGAMWRWDASRYRLLLAAEQGFLFAELAEEPDGFRDETGRLIWTGPDLRVRHTFVLADPVRSAVLAPDGRRAAILLSRGEVIALDLESGAAVTLADLQLGPDAWPAMAPFDDLLQVAVEIPDDQAPPAAQPHRLVRLDWDGTVIADLRAPGYPLTFSPDGRWMTWVEWPMDRLAPVTVVADAWTLEPGLRAFGVTTCFPAVGSGGARWLSDGSGLVVHSSDGYRLLTPAGELRALPAFSGQDWKGEPQPAPDDPDLFALGRIAVSDGAGTDQMGITLEGFVTPYGHVNPWGRDSAVLRFVLPPKPGGGMCEERPPMETAVQVQAGPIPEFPLVVAGVEGCLPLIPREFGTGEACLPNGTRLVPYRPRSDVPALGWYADAWRLWVRTEDGQIGEISLEGTPLRWALD